MFVKPLVVPVVRRTAHVADNTLLHAVCLARSSCDSIAPRRRLKVCIFHKKSIIITKRFC